MLCKKNANFAPSVYCITEMRKIPYHFFNRYDIISRKQGQIMLRQFFMGTRDKIIY